MKIKLSEIKVEKGIQIPNYTVAGKIHEMKHGDSVFFKEFRKGHSFATRIRQLGYKSNHKKVKGGFRVWKLEKAVNSQPSER